MRNLFCCWSIRAGLYQSWLPVCSLSRKSAVAPNNLKTSPERFWPYMQRGTRTCLFCLSKNQSQIAFRKGQSCIGHWWCAKHYTRADANSDGNSQSPGNGLMLLSCPPVPLSTADPAITAFPPKDILSPFIFFLNLYFYHLVHVKWLNLFATWLLI